MAKISQEVQKAIEIAIKKTVAAMQTHTEEQTAGQRNYFKETERLLYSLPALKLSLAEYDEDIKNNTLVSSRNKSKDIVIYSTGGGAAAQEEAITESKLASVERTRKQIQRIERALETVKEDQYYDIIPLKYWDLVQSLEIAEKLNCDERTYRRHKNRLVNKIKIVLFGADALERG